MARLSERPTGFVFIWGVPGRFDVIIDGRVEFNLSKRATMIGLVKALVAMRVAPEEIEAVARAASPVR